MGLRLMADKHPQPRHEPADGRLTSVGAMPEKTVGYALLFYLSLVIDSCILQSKPGV